jgi:formylglycine-generating enzyme required for sulfatase activity
MSGNLAEWTDSYYQPPLRETTSSYLRDSGNPIKDRSQFRILAGGRFKLGAPSALTNSASVNAPEYLSSTTGLRIARTISKE